MERQARPPLETVSSRTGRSLRRGNGGRDATGTDKDCALLISGQSRHSLGNKKLVARPNGRHPVTFLDSIVGKDSQCVKSKLSTKVGGKRAESYPCPIISLYHMVKGRSNLRNRVHREL